MKNRVVIHLDGIKVPRICFSVTDEGTVQFNVMGRFMFWLRRLMTGKREFDLTITYDHQAPFNT